jgi:predicted metal-dependent phosphoesterase TrpH
MHSRASDGTDDPADLPALAAAAGLAGIALTDHDTTAGLPACRAAADDVGIAFLPGIELSADPASIAPPTASGEPAEPRGTLHLLGYGIDPDDPTLAAVTARLRDARAARNPQMIQRLNELGVRLTEDEVLAAAGADRDPDTVVGRPHIAQVMVRKGYVKSIHEAFERYIGRRGAAYCRKDRLSAEQAIRTLHAAGGLVSLAHPVQLRLTDDALEHAVATLAKLGLDAIEVIHSDHRPEDVARFHALADRFKLLPTGGSDYHGDRKPVKLGQPAAPLPWMHQLQHRLTDAAAL